MAAERCESCGGGFAEAVLPDGKAIERTGARIGDGDPYVFHRARIASPGVVHPPKVTEALFGERRPMVRGWHVDAGTECFTVDDLTLISEGGA